MIEVLQRDLQLRAVLQIGAGGIGQAGAPLDRDGAVLTVRELCRRVPLRKGLRAGKAPPRAGIVHAVPTVLIGIEQADRAVRQHHRQAEMVAQQAIHRVLHVLDDHREIQAVRRPRKAAPFALALDEFAALGIVSAKGDRVPGRPVGQIAVRRDAVLLHPQGHRGRAGTRRQRQASHRRDQQRRRRDQRKDPFRSAFFHAVSSFLSFKRGQIAAGHRLSTGVTARRPSPVTHPF